MLQAETDNKAKEILLSNINDVINDTQDPYKTKAILFGLGSTLNDKIPNAIAYGMELPEQEVRSVLEYLEKNDLVHVRHDFFFLSGEGVVYYNYSLNNGFADVIYPNIYLDDLTKEEVIKLTAPVNNNMNFYHSIRKFKIQKNQTKELEEEIKREVENLNKKINEELSHINNNVEDAKFQFMKVSVSDPWFSDGYEQPTEKYFNAKVKYSTIAEAVNKGVLELGGQVKISEPYERKNEKSLENLPLNVIINNLEKKGYLLRIQFDPNNVLEPFWTTPLEYQKKALKESNEIIEKINMIAHAEKFIERVEKGVYGLDRKEFEAPGE